MGLAQNAVGSNAAIRKHSMKICIPTVTDEGLDSVPYTHLGSASYFVLHDTETGETKVIRNRNEHHEHREGLHDSLLSTTSIVKVLRCHLHRLLTIILLCCLVVKAVYSFF